MEDLLGIEVDYLADGSIKLHQQRYIEKIVSRFLPKGPLEPRGPWLGLAQAGDEAAEVDDVLSRLRERDDLGLAARERDALLLPRAPRQRRRLPKHAPARRRVAHLPRRVGEAGEALLLGRVGEAGGREPREVGEGVVALLEQLGRRLLHALAQLVHKVGEVRARARGGVHHAADPLLQRLHEVRVFDRRLGERVHEVLRSEF